jgi:hypothetical protein
VIESLFVGSENYADVFALNALRVDNVYETGFRLSAELGLSINAGERDWHPGVLIHGNLYPEAEKQWSGMMAVLGNDVREGRDKVPVVLFNPYGGEAEPKGFMRSDEDRERMAQVVSEIVSRGYKVVIVPNGTAWGTKIIADDFLNSLPDDIHRHCVVSQEPSADARLIKYYVGFADYVLTVEGGMMHLAYNIGKPFSVLMMAGSGKVKWIPYGRSLRQGVIQDVGGFFGEYQGARSAGNDAAALAGEMLKGGVDFDTTRMALAVQNSVNSVKFPIGSDSFRRFGRVDGFTPVIVDVSPTVDISRFLNIAVKASGFIQFS